MKRKLLAALAIAAVAVTSLIGSASDPVSAGTEVTHSVASPQSVASPAAPTHSYDNFSLFYCTKHRSADWWTIVHAIPYFLSTTQVGYYCLQRFFEIEEQYWVVVNLPRESNMSWKPWQEQRCISEGPFPCYWPEQ